ncbi:MAG: type II toxin-antitoxin system VapC family toxin [Candidatus Bathyarchaeia archaeon]
MERIVVDASVLVKWFVDEEGSREALAIRRRYVEGEVEIVARELIIFETLNALRYKGGFSRRRS